ncbi:hypothetical protein K501DRAFT_279189 [Backusella circina FSU 941]|nr:hypothetical protein K501DRAFT_279189 [Backusella circina FSU 941]
MTICGKVEPPLLKWRVFTTTLLNCSRSYFTAMIYCLLKKKSVFLFSLVVSYSSVLEIEIFPESLFIPCITFYAHFMTQQKRVWFSNFKVYFMLRKLLHVMFIVINTMLQ